MDLQSGSVTGRGRAVLAKWATWLYWDIKLSWRGLIRAPALTATAVASLAIAIGGNTAMFSLIEPLILRTAPYAEPEELVDIRLAGPPQDIGFSYRTFRQFQDATKQTFSGVAAAMVNRVLVSDATGTYGSSPHELVAGPYFQVLGIGAQIGRVFTPDEGVEVGADPVVVLSDEYWRRTFDGDPAVVGREVSLNGFRYTIVGVAAPGFAGMVPGLKSSFWTPATMAGQIYVSRVGKSDPLEEKSLLAIGRLASGATLADAQAVARGFHDEHLGTDIYTEHRIEVTPVLTSEAYPVWPEGVFPALAVVGGVLAVLLLLACVNLSTLFLARAEARRHEFAVHQSLGTGRARLIRRLLAESMMVTLIGGAAGVFLSVILVEAISTTGLASALPVTVDSEPSAVVLLFGIGLSLLAGLLMGLVSSVSLTHSGIAAILGKRRTGEGHGAARVRRALLFTQIVLTAMLAVAASGHVRTWMEAYRQEPGFGKHPAAIASLTLGPSRPEGERRGYYDSYLRQVRDIPGVVSAGAVTLLPLQRNKTSIMGITIPGVDPPPGSDLHLVDWASVEGDYFDAMGIPLLAGRFFDSRDTKGAPTVALLSRTMAKRYWPDQEAIGQQFSVCEDCWVTVVGVVGDVKIRELSEADRPVVYTRLAQSPYHDATIVVRTRDDSDSIIRDMTALGTGLDSLVYVFSLGTLKQHISTSLMPLRIPAILVGAIGGFSLLLAAIGVYGIVSYTVAARRRELAIRVSLGANPTRLSAAVIRSAAKLIVAGLVVGFLLTVVVGRELRDTPYGFRPMDPVDLACSAGVLLGVGLLAAYHSVRRAIRLQPLHALSEQ